MELTEVVNGGGCWVLRRRIGRTLGVWNTHLNDYQREKALFGVFWRSCRGVLEAPDTSGRGVYNYIYLRARERYKVQEYKCVNGYRVHATGTI